MARLPVVFLVFNRPEHTAKVFSAIRDAKPERLLIVADGPRDDHPEDVDKCKSVRSVVANVDWDCEVLTRFSNTNLGCASNVSQGITWAFEQVESAIILEDDCLPGPDFFRFCEELVPRYQNDSRVGMITGDNLFPIADSPYSYHFSQLALIWGWATWRSAWEKYDRTLTKWPEIRECKSLENYFQDEHQATYWKGVFDSVHQLNPRSSQHTWDFQWSYTHLINNWLVIMPEQNLVKNIGFDRDATHTRSKPAFSLPEIGSVTFPVKHPPSHLPLRSLDQKVYENILAPGKPPKKGFFRRLKSSVKKRLFPTLEEICTS